VDNFANRDPIWHFRLFSLEKQVFLSYLFCSLKSRYELKSALRGEMSKKYKVFHSYPSEHEEAQRKSIHVVLVRPEHPGNIGSTVRAMANMGIHGNLYIVGRESSCFTEETLKLARHAVSKLEEANFLKSINELPCDRKTSLLLASTARCGSASRPHPLMVREAVEKAVGKLLQKQIENLYLVFGPESDGLTNEETDFCDWIATIPSNKNYASLNLSHAAMVFFHEANQQMIQGWQEVELPKPGQKEKLVTHLLELAEKAEFILPGDPYKMRAKLEDVFSKLPNHIPEVKTLHGLIYQVSRCLTLGKVERKGRYKYLRDEVKANEH